MHTCGLTVQSYFISYILVNKKQVFAIAYRYTLKLIPNAKSVLFYAVPYIHIEWNTKKPTRNV